MDRKVKKEAVSSGLRAFFIGLSVEDLSRLIYGIGAFCAGTLMVVLFAAGFWEIGKSVAVFFHLTPGPEAHVAPESQGIIVALKGIEYLFLAPMSFLTYLSLARYVVDRTRGGSGGTADARVTETKRLITSLMFAVVATDLIGRMLSLEGLIARAPIYELALLVVLGAYTFLLHCMTPRGD